MGLEGFIEPFCCALEHHQRGRNPTDQDRQFLDIAITQFKEASIADASPYLDKFLQALILQEVWAQRNISDAEIHSYMSSTLWQFMRMHTDLLANRFFYHELNDERVVNQGLTSVNTRGVWKRKGDLCLFVGGLLGDYLRGPKPKTQWHKPSPEETRKAGKIAYMIAQDLFSTLRAEEEQNLAQICGSIRENYEALEESLYALGKKHFFPEPEKLRPGELVVPVSVKAREYEHEKLSGPKTMGELLKTNKLCSAYEKCVQELDKRTPND